MVCRSEWLCLRACAGPSLVLPATPILEHITPETSKATVAIQLNCSHICVKVFSAMRLIDTVTGEFAEFVDSSTAPFYAILSHTWVRPPEREQSYQEVVKIQEKFALSSSLAGEVPSDHLPNSTPAPISQRVIPAASGPPIPLQPTFPRPSPSMFSVLIMRSFLITTPPRASPLPGYSISLHPEQRSEFQIPRPWPPRRTIWDPDSGLSEKVRKACEIARLDGYRYIWVDSSCIDKTSSSELSEAINSMFKWYRDAQVCYALLSDVPSNKDALVLDPNHPNFLREVRKEGAKDKFRKSRWFKRSWTLQELIAPRTVVFLSKDWKGLGTKDSLADVIEAITHIDRDILTHRNVLAGESVAERMRWAAEREATRVEDEAYSLLGIFGITMPTLYGEGRQAFQRLQEEILQRIPDRTIFAWGECEPLPDGPGCFMARDVAISPFASSPRSFHRFEGKMTSLSQGDFDSLGLQAEEYTLTPHGVRAKLSFIPLDPTLNVDLNDPTNRTVDPIYLVLLGFQQFDNSRHILGKPCSITRIDGDIELLRVSGRDSLIFTISPDALVGAHNLELRSVYLPYQTPSIDERRPTSGPYQVGPSWTPTLSISLSPWATDVLPPGYTIWATLPTERHPKNVPLHIIFQRVRNNPLSICIQFRYMIDSQATIIEARIWILPLGDSDETVEIDTLLQSSPPYTSAIWSARPRESPPSLTSRNVHLVALQSGPTASVALRLWLGFGAPSHCNTNVEVVTSVPSPSREISIRAQAALEDLPRGAMHTSHAHLKFTMLGSVSGALEAQGYSVHLEEPGAGDAGDSDSLSLIISNVDSGFTVRIKYFQTLYQDPKQCLIVVARVTLESVLRDGSDGRYQDGPYVACWSDTNTNGGWQWCLARKEIRLISPTGDLLILRLGFDLAWESEYYLVVNIGGDRGSGSQDSPPNSMIEKPHDHRDIALTLPGHIKHALQVYYGCEVHFERPGEDQSSPYHLTLSNADVAIDIKYSRHLSTGSGGHQVLTLRACVTASPSLHGSQDAATRPRPSCRRIVDWDAWRSISETCTWTGRVGGLGGWYWDPQQEDVSLALPTGAELTLRLGFYVLWPSEYCLMVEIPVLRMAPLPQVTSHERLRPFASDTKRESNHENAGDDLKMETVMEESA